MADRLRSGRCAVLWRHAQTTPGVGDPPGFQLKGCSTQRNLSEEGRAQARAAGEWFSHAVCAGADRAFQCLVRARKRRNWP